MFIGMLKHYDHRMFFDNQVSGCELGGSLFIVPWQPFMSRFTIVDGTFFTQIEVFICDNF
jgi:hypothetical protein